MLFNSTEHVLFSPLGKPEEKILIEIALPVDVVFRHILSSISGCSGSIFAIFSPYESALRADDGSVLYFRICQRRTQRKVLACLALHALRQAGNRP